MRLLFMWFRWLGVACVGRYVVLLLFLRLFAVFLAGKSLSLVVCTKPLLCDTETLGG